MDIKKFTKSEFGTLTTITNEKTGVVMFLAKEIGKMWGHSNMKQVVTRLLNEQEYKVVNKSEHPKFFKLLVSNKLLPSKAQRIQFVTESGVYKLALASNLEKAKPFKDWVTSEVLPAIRKHGYYSLADQSNKIMIHASIPVQKSNSKAVNSKNYIERGIEGIIQYNRESCLLHTGKSTKDIKEMGKKVGLKSVERSSAKEVLRHTKPELACAMSFTDSLTQQGFDLKTVSELALKAAVPLFQGMIELGIRPAELDD